MFGHLVRGDEDSAAAHHKFYDECSPSWMSRSATTSRLWSAVSQKHDLLDRRMRVRGEHVDTAAIRRTALMTVDGELDDICVPEQTIMAQAICSGIPASGQVQYLQPGVGHYGIFNGRRWRSDILPRLSGFIAASSPPATVSWNACASDRLSKICGRTVRVSAWPSFTRMNALVV